MEYFPKKQDKWSVDFKGETKVGDIVVITKTKERTVKNLNTVIDSILFQVGETIDPVTGRRCRGTQFIDEKSRKEEQSERRVKEYKIKRLVEEKS
ncbi:small ribosomal subunit protein uS17m-like [Ruditapes philippinarum]|uniref:small ribosomal subunit protein uS17m-like n=1 Tax=Ruditapes philippinarum TaxID=129788 RepID=UPI00295B01CF|nr:small ribosomal subunit protein uS17m-like [Ruditapes philippinarum]